MILRVGYGFRWIVSRLEGQVKGGERKAQKGARLAGIWLVKPSIVGIATTGSMGGPRGESVGGIPAATMAKYQGNRER